MTAIKAAHQTEAMSLNKVFVSERGFFRNYKTEKVQGMFRDMSSIEFIVEELIANAAHQIVFISWGKEEDKATLSKLAVPLRKRVKFIDDHIPNEIANKIMAPVFEEYDVQSSGYVLQFRPGCSHDETSNAIGTCCFTLREFIIGVRNKLQIDIDMKGFSQAVSVIRRNSKNPMSRHNMSVIEGIIGCYKPVMIDNLVMLPNATKDHSNMLMDFLEDHRYLALSQAHAALGIPILLSKSVKNIKQVVRHVLSNDRFKIIFDGSSKLITAGTRVPLPSTELISAIAITDYLPTIVDKKSLMSKAHKAWVQLRGPSIPPEGFWKR